jgi:hypothetical protein
VLAAARQHAIRGTRRWRLTFCAAAALTWLASCACAEDATIDFDIPAQPLAAAIERFIETTGQDLIYNSNLAAGRRSHPVRGQLSTDAALAMLLRDSGLSVRRAANGSIMLKSAAIGQQPAMSAATGDFYARIQSGLRTVFCGSPDARPGRYRIAMRLWVDRAGRLTRYDLIGSGGSDVIDSAIRSAVSRLDIGASPPADLEQPVVIVIQPQAPGVTMGCDDIAARSTHAAP